MAPVAKPAASGSPSMNLTDFPREFSVDVDGDVFTVRISALNKEVLKESPAAAESGKSKRALEGAVVSHMAGLVLSLEVKVGDRIGEGDLVAMIEAMKMRRPVHSPRSGTVREILAKEGEIVEAEDALMVVI